MRLTKKERTLLQNAVDEIKRCSKLQAEVSHEDDKYNTPETFEQFAQANNDLFNAKNKLTEVYELIFGPFVVRGNNISIALALLDKDTGKPK